MINDDISGGLPPQVRGALRCPTGSRCTWRAYPRRCGEHMCHAVTGTRTPGLPPQVRGARYSDGVWWCVGGLTPAGAGSTLLPGCCRGGLTPAGAGSTCGVPPQQALERAYPRRCGEHIDRAGQAPARLGLPPQVRGAPGSRMPGPAGDGLTPAGAGSTFQARWDHMHKRAYPRRCGEHRFRVGGSRSLVGLTPAGAGSTWVLTSTI